MKALRHGLADILSGEEIQKNCQIDKARHDPDIGNVGDPCLIDSGNLAVLQKIVIETVTMIALGRPDPFLLRTAE